MNKDNGPVRGLAVKALPPAEKDLIAEHMRDILAALGEDPRREGLLKTPERVAQALRDMTSGYAADIDSMINSAIFTEAYNEMVLVKDITFYSNCEHHLLPFFGKAHVAYIPDGKIIGLSKIPKLVDIFARRLQVQERMTSQIAQTLRNKLQPLGVGVIIEARHLCMEMRGAESLLSPTVTSAMLGCFQKDQRTREEFLKLVKP
ncbi:MAG: GTP cyclohydrolase I FolE [Elusimicrobia bacterium RIFCSPHIGHO2_02_FULL_57_9]|nr:MAG: GTP cyclohydrolase I FolE [Elusimicrobia bacterium RIFCSPHIGHO2_02_FULL_57_9]